MSFKTVRNVFLLLLALCMTGCDATTSGQTTLLTPTQAPQTERGGVAVGNRFFIASGNKILELLPQPDGSNKTKVAYQRSDCSFTGMAVAGSKIYAACTAVGISMQLNGQSMGMPAWSDLVRIDLSRNASDPKYIAKTRLGDNKMFPNGMAVAGNGDIYITNTYSMIFQLLSLFPPEMIDSITRVRITDQARFTIRKTTALPATLGGMTPNGIQIQGSKLWFVSMNVLYEARIGTYGLYDLKTIYQADMLRMFDDFAILPDNLVAIAEFNTMATMLAIFFPGAGPPACDPSQLTFVSTAAGTYASRAGQVVHKHILPGIIPSSATAITDAKGDALYVTDFFLGGLYRVAR